MTATEPREAPAQAVAVRPVGRLGRWAATHFGVVVVVWVLIAGGLGFFAPRVEHALSGAG